MDEMLQDTLEVEEDEDLEEEADAEVDKVLYELTDGKLGEAGSVGALPVRRIVIIMFFLAILISYTVLTKTSGGRGDGQDNGEVQAGVEWLAEWVVDMYLI
jgi:hypothetical protein